MRKALYAVLATAILVTAVLVPLTIARQPWHETHAANTTTVSSNWGYACGTVVIEPASADIIVTFGPAGADTDGVVVPVGGFTFVGVDCYSVSLARATSTAVEVWAW